VEPELIISDRGIAHTLLIRDASRWVAHRSPLRRTFQRPALTSPFHPCVYGSADLDFETPFRLVISRPGDLRAFVLSFDVIFAAAAFAQEVTLTTGVAADPTHWKQTVLWLTPENSAPAQAGDVVTGALKYVRGANNARDYTIAVTWRMSSGGAEERSQSFLLAA